jgi:hypothetical protein
VLIDYLILIIDAHSYVAAEVMSSDLIVKILIMAWDVRAPAGIAFPQLPEGVGTSAWAL